MKSPMAGRGACANLEVDISQHDTMGASSFPSTPPAIPDTSLAAAGTALANRPYVRRGIAFTDRRIRVLIVDDHTVVRRALHCLLRHAATDIEVIAEASGGREAVEIAVRLAPDVVVMDLDMAEGDGETATRVLREQLPAARVLVLTVHAEEERLLPLLRAGARGYLTKDAADQELVDAIRVVASGDVYLRPRVARRLAALGESAARTEARACASRTERLSAREQTVLRLTAEGFNGPEIGEQLGITAKTVDTYKQRIEDKIGLTHRSAYVRFALECGWLRDRADQRTDEQRGAERP